MPTLQWIGKSAVVGHHLRVPFHMLRTDAERSVEPTDSGNLLVEGDNLIALKALLPYYARQVRCIYIDPPYNTGNEGWVYNDNVASPEIRAWLGRVVGREAEDLSRHEKWLCMMYPRLALLREFLRPDGAIFISIDDNEQAALRMLMDEIFGANNFVANIVWQKRTSPDARLHLGPAHDYIVMYAKHLDLLKPMLKRISLSGERMRAFKNPDHDPRGPWASVDITGQTGHATADQFYDIRTPAGKVIKPPPGRCWAMAERTFLELVRDNRIWWGKRGTSRPRLKKFLSEAEGVTAWTWWPNTEVGHNQEATKELNEVMGRADVFENPKPTRLIRRILELATDKDSLVLDSFAGSGTTGHAVLAQNAADGGTRRFILVEMDPEIAQTITAQRLSRVIRGYRHNGTAVDGLGGSYRYCTLGPPLLNERGAIREDVRFAELAAHVFFLATGAPLAGRPRGPLLGVHNGIGVYLLFNGVVGDRSVDGGNVLTASLLTRLPTHDGPRIIYGEGCRLGTARLKREGIVFRQIPYAIRVG